MSPAPVTSEPMPNGLEYERRSWLSIDGTGAYRHLFGPVIFSALITLFFIASVWLCLGNPPYPTDVNQTINVEPSNELATLSDAYIKDYKDTLTRLDSNIALQAFLIVTTVLLVIRQSDSLTLFGNSIPLSWLHFFVPVLALALWLALGFILHELIWGRIGAVDIITTLRRPTMELQKARLRDAGFIDGWFVSFVDPLGKDYSGINRGFAAGTAAVLVLLLGTLISAAHASILAILPISCRRYLPGTSKERLSWYYFAPFPPLLVLLLSYFQFAYRGANRNWLQLYVAALTMPLMAILLWLSMIVDRKFDAESVQCLRRQRSRTCLDPSNNHPSTPRWASRRSRQ
jgi:hypothetical protein